MHSITLCLVQSTNNESFLFPNVSHQAVTVCFRRSVHIYPRHCIHYLFVTTRYIQWYCINSIEGLKKVNKISVIFTESLSWRSAHNTYKISGFRYQVDENCALQCYYVSGIWNFVQIFGTIYCSSFKANQGLKDTWKWDQYDVPKRR